MTSAAATVTPILVKLPTSAAASAATMNSAYASGMSGTMGAISTPPTPAITVLSAQFTSAMRCGDRPVTNAPFSDSAAARVARPKRVNRNQSVSATAMRMMTAVNQSRSPGTRLPSISYTW